MIKNKRYSPFVALKRELINGMTWNFKSESFQDLESVKEVEENLDSIESESEHHLQTFYTSHLSKGPPVEDEINNTPNLEENLTAADLEEVKYYEELLRKEFGPK